MLLTTNRKGDERLAALCIMLTAACGYDYRRKKIPNYLMALVVVFGVWYRLGESGIDGALSYLGEAVLIICLLYPFFKIGSIGAGCKIIRCYGRVSSLFKDLGILICFFADFGNDFSF